MTSHSLPEGLRSAIANDLQPVQPLPPTWRRTLVVAAVVTVVIAAALTVLKLRFDVDQMPVWLSWGCSLLELTVGLVVVGLALRESIPGRALTSGAVAGAAVLATGLQILVGLTTWFFSPGMPMPSDAAAAGMSCLRHDTTLGLPALAATLWLVFRALPLRPSIAGLLGGAGAGLTADAVTHLLCPVSDLRHVLVWHTGAILLLMAAGWLIGKAWEWYRWRR